MVRSGRMLGDKLRLEYPLGPYTLDFVCIELQLDIEIDGKGHLTDDSRQRDTFASCDLPSRPVNSHDRQSRKSHPAPSDAAQ